MDIINVNFQKKSVVFFSTLSCLLSIYGYYELLSIVPVFAEILVIFDSSLSVSTTLIIQTHYYFGLLSIVGFLGLLLTIVDKINPTKAYLLIISNVVFMLCIRWYTAHQLDKSLLNIGIIQ